MFFRTPAHGYVFLFCLAWSFSGNHTFAEPLDPDEPSFDATVMANGALSVSSGTINIGTDALTISGAITATGTLRAQNSTFNPTIAVFPFADLFIGGTAEVNVTRSRPLALLSRSHAIIEVFIDISGQDAGPNASPNGGPGGGSGGDGSPVAADGEGPGGGKGASNNSTDVNGSGGGFGGLGGEACDMNGDCDFDSRGVPYGELITALEAGSGGGGGIDASGGAAGGALELGAVGTVIVSETLRANGGTGRVAIGVGGAGSGGGLLVHGGNVSITGGLIASGGDQPFFDTGGGGRITVLGHPSTFTFGDAVDISFAAAFGGSSLESGPAAAGGVITIGPNLTVIPGGQNVTLDGTPIIASGGPFLSSLKQRSRSSVA